MPPQRWLTLVPAGQRRADCGQQECLLGLADGVDHAGVAQAGDADDFAEAQRGQGR
jgi:hypothetical protein